jgi:hypothetical protein
MSCYLLTYLSKLQISQLAMQSSFVVHFYPICDIVPYEKQMIPIIIASFRMELFGLWNQWFEYFSIILKGVNII